MEQKNALVGLITSHVSKDLLTNQELQQVSTPWGKAEVILGYIGDKAAACILRYGPQVTLASHRVNYCANIWAMRKLGVQRIISQNAIGSINPAMPPGTIVIPHDFMDFTKNRPLSFFENEDCWIRVDMNEPFCPELRGSLTKVALDLDEKAFQQGIFICTEGPRLETPAEIAFYRRQGGDIIGTPLVPEVVLAREAGICFASLSVVINYAAGLGPVVKHGGDDGIITYYRRTKAQEKVEQIIFDTFKTLPTERQCGCEGAFELALHGTPPDWISS